MAINYTLIKKQDEHRLTVQQVTTYVLTYISDGSDERIATATLSANQTFVLITPKDGQYRLTLSATGETDVQETFYVIRFLQNSIIADTLTLLCDCSNTYINNDCKTKSEQEAIAIRGLFSKVFAFQFQYVSTYGADYPNIFTTFLSKASQLFTCKFQTAINSLLLQECVTGCIGNTSKISKLYMTMYWSAMYFTERTIVDTTIQEDVDLLKTKFNYDKIVGCICDTCVEIADLEALFTTTPTTDQIYSFQFPTTDKDISDIGEVDSAFLSTNGELQPEVDLIAGKAITFTNIGRFGFVINTTNQTPFRIFDILNNDITETTFTRQYDAATQRVFYVSLNIFPPNSIYFRFVKQ
jgi:predicted nucleic acid-binding Zn finger protein